MMMGSSIKEKLRNFDYCNFFKPALNRKQQKGVEGVLVKHLEHLLMLKKPHTCTPRNRLSFAVVSF